MTGISYEEPPIERISNAFLAEHEVTLLILREDLNHPQAGGNKWWKLKYNLVEAAREKHRVVLTFGGAFSNHIYATAAAAKLSGFGSIGIIRGEKTSPLNPVLAFAEEQGMELKYISRAIYKAKSQEEFIKMLREEIGPFYLIPEGGSNEAAMKGCVEWGQKLREGQFDYLCLPVGTGTTAAGLITGLQNKKKVIGFSVLKGDFLAGEIEVLIKNRVGAPFLNWRIENDYHFGGYAKSTKELLDFINSFQEDFDIPLEPVYSGKMMAGIFDMIKQKKIESGSVVMAIHTGGVHR